MPERTRMLVGLGNPGPRYAQTRHNVGFWAIDLLAERKGLKVERHGHQALYAEWRYGADRIVLLKPQTYMNLSGESVGPAARWYKVAPAEIIVIYDDMDLETGRLRIREKGSSGGHNGMKSIIQHLGSEDFPRIRIGVGRPAPGWTVENWVLSAFSADELPLVQQAVSQAADAIEVALKFGIPRAANDFNK